MTVSGAVALQSGVPSSVRIGRLCCGSLILLLAQDLDEFLRFHFPVIVLVIASRSIVLTADETICAALQTP